MSLFVDHRQPAHYKLYSASHTCKPSLLSGPLFLLWFSELLNKGLYSLQVKKVHYSCSSSVVPGIGKWRHNMAHSRASLLFPSLKGLSRIQLGNVCSKWNRESTCSQSIIIKAYWTVICARHWQLIIGNRRQENGVLPLTLLNTRTQRKIRECWKCLKEGETIQLGVRVDLERWVGSYPHFGEKGDRGKEERLRPIRRLL